MEIGLRNDVHEDAVQLGSIRIVPEAIIPYPFVCLMGDESNPWREAKRKDVTILVSAAHRGQVETRALS